MDWGPIQRRVGEQKYEFLELCFMLHAQKLGKALAEWACV